MTDLEFASSTPFTLGVELELQVVNTRDFNLTRGAPDLLAKLEKAKLPGAVKPEIAESMIEVNTAVCDRFSDLLKSLTEIRDALIAQADRLNLAIAGGGAHPFQKWSEQRIYPTDRFRYISDLYGYLAKQFTVFGQHIHVGCANGDDAVYLTHALSRYIPHFIALSASSPFYQGIDTSFDSSRLNAVNAFPLSGCMPFVETWAGFNAYFARMYEYKIVASIKDFYWDIRPKPEYGTVEIRVCDTPLTIAHAARLAAYAQALARMLLTERPETPPDIYSLYNYNRFQACRFGLHGYIINPYTKQHVTLIGDIQSTLKQLEPYSKIGDAEAALRHLSENAAAAHNDTAWLRARYGETLAFAHVVRAQTEIWRQ
jgi:glutamate---cysteine ligase / carboxylate-amine ligase